MEEFNTPSRKLILDIIFQEFCRATSSLIAPEESNKSSISNQFLKAKALIELLEIHDIGSLNGVDPDSPTIKITGFTLFDRFLSRLKKYHNYSEFEPINGMDMVKLIAYFKNRLNEVHESTIALAKRLNIVIEITKKSENTEKAEYPDKAEVGKNLKYWTSRPRPKRRVVKYV